MRKKKEKERGRKGGNGGGYIYLSMSRLSTSSSIHFCTFSFPYLSSNSTLIGSNFYSHSHNYNKSTHNIRMSLGFPTNSREEKKTEKFVIWDHLQFVCTQHLYEWRNIDFCSAYAYTTLNDSLFFVEIIFFCCLCRCVNTRMGGWINGMRVHERRKKIKHAIHEAPKKMD